jgi:hypothetical protein
LKPLGIVAAMKAINAQTHETSAAQRQLELSLQQARYEAAHARRQYDAVDPANRLVAGELERRWNEALQAVHRLEGEIAAIVAAKSPPLGERERQQMMQLGADLELAWSHPAATAATRKRILRTALNEIVVRKEGAVIDMAGRAETRGYDSARARAGPVDAGSTDCTSPQSFGQADGIRQRMDRAACAWLSQTPRHSRLPRWRMVRARRDHARCGRADHRRCEDDSTTHDPTQRSHGTAGLQGCALGHQGGRRGSVCRPEATSRTGNTKLRAADVRFSMRYEDAY